MKSSLICLSLAFCITSVTQLIAIDQDNDGVSDHWAIKYSVVSAAWESDADGDGASLLDEALAGTNPYDAASTPPQPQAQVTTTEGDGPNAGRFYHSARVSWPLVDGKAYRLEEWNGSHWISRIANARYDNSAFRGQGEMVVHSDVLSGQPTLRVLSYDVDTDGDGLTDWEELNPIADGQGGWSKWPSDPYVSDTDGDGLTDSWEWLLSGLGRSPEVVDADGGYAGWPDSMENIAHSEVILHGPDAQPYDRYGQAVAATDNYLAISSNGQVHVYERLIGDGWTLAATLQGEGADASRFGRAIALDDNWLAVGSFTENAPITMSGRVYLYYREQTGAWQLQQMLVPDVSVADDYFGFSLDLDAVNGRLIVGATIGNGHHSGRAFVFRYVMTLGQWIQEAQLMQEGTNLASMSGNYAGDQFGFSVSISGGWAVVGAADAAVNGQGDIGKAYLYSYSAEEGWQLFGYINPSEYADNNHYGHSVAIHDDLLVIGAPSGSMNGYYKWGYADVFRYDAAAQNWGWEQKLYEHESWNGHRDMQFGHALDVRGQHILVGARNRHGKGAAYIYSWEPASRIWMRSSLLFSGREVHDMAGAAVALSNQWALVGAREWDAPVQSNNGSAEQLGSAHVYRLGLPSENTDVDADSMPDLWEWINMGSLAQGAQGDMDGDGLTNLTEYLLGSHPRIDESALANLHPDSFERSAGVDISLLDELGAATPQKRSYRKPPQANGTADEPVPTSFSLLNLTPSGEDDGYFWSTWFGWIYILGEQENEGYFFWSLSTQLWYYYNIGNGNWLWDTALGWNWYDPAAGVYLFYNEFYDSWAWWQPTSFDPRRYYIYELESFIQVDYRNYGVQDSDGDGLLDSFEYDIYTSLSNPSVTAAHEIDGASFFADSDKDGYLGLFEWFMGAQIDSNGQVAVDAHYFTDAEAANVATPAHLSDSPDLILVLPDQGYIYADKEGLLVR